MEKLSQWFDADYWHTEVLFGEGLATKGLTALAVIVAAVWLSRLLQRTAEHSLRQNGQNDDAVIRAYKSIIRYVVMVPAVLVAIHVMGVDLSSLFTTGGLFALALAFAMKNIAENFVSGIMLRFERAIKPGDVLETEGVLVRVKTIGLRATTVRSKDEKDLLIPNSELVQNTLANCTYRDSLCRVWTIIGVAYHSDLDKVREVLERVCSEMEGKSDQHPPVVQLTELGSSSINYKISVWIENPWDAGHFKSSLNESIMQGLKEEHITLAYPHLDVRLNDVTGGVEVQQQKEKEI